MGCYDLVRIISQMIKNKCLIRRFKGNTQISTFSIFKFLKEYNDNYLFCLDLYWALHFSLLPHSYGRTKWEVLVKSGSRVRLKWGVWDHGFVHSTSRFPSYKAWVLLMWLTLLISHSGMFFSFYFLLSPVWRDLEYVFLESWGDFSNSFLPGQGWECKMSLWVNPLLCFLFLVELFNPCRYAKNNLCFLCLISALRWVAQSSHYIIFFFTPSSFTSSFTSISFCSFSPLPPLLLPPFTPLINLSLPIFLLNIHFLTDSLIPFKQIWRFRFRFSLFLSHFNLKELINTLWFVSYS